MNKTRKLRWTLGALVAIILAVVAGAVIFFFFIPEDDPTSLKTFPADQQQKKAQLIVDGLNTHDVSKVYVVRGNNTTDARELAAQRQQDETVRAAMPAAGCQYVLKSVDDKGEQGTKVITGLTKEHRVWRLELNVEEQCPAQPLQSRTLDLDFIQFMAHWTPVSFAN
ncbi:hypothetical protein PP451_07140 [Mycobacteroides abscessus]|uniref:hypothetical protein n=1 Tax=Mycobacteroides abscessus TaxID=36809 RepID=UPI0013FD0621|nr:hypothetical protein [Mycobacteroides abscessus]MDM2245749.1 hypothetical protein [Mycobacteroides abscessus]MDM2254433.1 hypothetical protein [Mycobacteroides abscessus]MDM2260187.1 hypothetical protein [Mycobacteroides abscessus]MDM2264252.1 hypothetical protein [Mycobacteroides abscessus]